MIISYIEEKAEKLLKELSLFEVPINVSKCVDLLGIDLEEVDLDDQISGFFVSKDKVPYIRVNKRDMPRRKRFTIAHELGHFLLHSSNDNSLFVDKIGKVMFRDVKSSTGELLKEREANAFAAALLMPVSLIEEEADRLPDDLKDDIVSQLAKMFEVSNEAMGIRLSKLGMLEFGLF